MITPERVQEDTWLDLSKFTRRKIVFLTIGANLIGALIVTCYFTFFDEGIVSEQITNTFIVLGVMFIGLVILAGIITRNWQKDLWRFIRLKASGGEIDPTLHQKAQRKILDMPFVSAMVSLFNWLLAAVTMSLHTAFWLSEANTRRAIFFDGLQTFIGVIISGIVVCAIIFFSVEIACRRVWLLMR